MRPARRRRRLAMVDAEIDKQTVRKRLSDTLSPGDPAEQRLDADKHEDNDNHMLEEEEVDQMQPLEKRKEQEEDLEKSQVGASN